jgi:hypothetical protein
VLGFWRIRYGKRFEIFPYWFPFLPSYFYVISLYSFLRLFSFLLLLSFLPSFFMLGGLIDKIQATWNSRTGTLQVQQSIYCHVFQWLKAWFELVIGFIDHLQVVTTIICNIVPDFQTTKYPMLISSQPISTSLHCPFPGNGYKLHPPNVTVLQTYIKSHTKYSNSSSDNFGTQVKWTPESKSKLCYDRRSVGQFVLEQSTHLGLKTRSLLLSDSFRLVDVGRSLWREDGSVLCQSHSQQ